MSDVRARRKPAWHKLALGAIVIAAIAALWRFAPVAEYLTPERVRGWAEVVRQTSWAPFALVAAYTPAALVLFPRPLLTLVAVVAFGTWAGVGLAAAGVLLAALATYYAGRMVRQETVHRLAGDAIRPVGEVLRRHGVMAIFALNMVPTPPFAVQGMIAGAVRVNLWHYMLGSALGMAPSLLAWTVFGRQLSRVLEDPGELSPGIIAAAVVFLAVVTYLVRRWFAKETAG